MCLSRCQPHSHANSVPFRESCNLPHTGHFLLLFLRFTLWTGIPLHCALYSMNWWSFLLDHMLNRLLRALSSLGLKTPLRSSRTTADLFSSACSICPFTPSSEGPCGLGNVQSVFAESAKGRNRPVTSS